MKKILSTSILLLALAASLQAQNKPSGLRTDLVERTDVVYVGGYPSAMTLEEVPQAIEGAQYAAVATPRPNFSWIVNGGGASDVMQTAYQIVLTRLVPKPAPSRRPASGQRPQGPGMERKVVWDSGKVESPQSSSVAYGGPDLEPSTVYYWTVKTWDNKGVESEVSDTKAFRTADELKPYGITIEPQVKNDQFPASMKTLSDGNLFLDYGKDCFGQLRLTFTAAKAGEKVVLHLGERIKDGRVDRQPFGSCRYRRIELTLMQGTHTYVPKILPDFRNSHGDAVLMPGYVGEVVPFRYVEIEGYDGKLAATDAVRMYVHHPFDNYSSDFRSSDDILNQIWDLCKYSMEATSFIGYHVDGDRERIPYECDGLINQLAWYGTESSYSLTRRSIQHLLEHPTWPTEWILQTVLMAWYDYLYTGDTRLLAAQYDLLAKHTLIDLKGENGLISTKAKEQDPAFLASINRTQPIRDIVDWPQAKGDFGTVDGHPGESDFFVFEDYNAVVNAYHYLTLENLAGIAAALGKTSDAASWQKAADEQKASFNKAFFNKKTGNYRDGIGTDHSALHSNMFPLAFGLVPEKQQAKVAAYAQSRGIACSIANAMILLHGMYAVGNDTYAQEILTATHDRSFYNTILAGSTMTFEAWDDKYKNNQDWNHAWGAAPADVLPHKFVGVEPASPAWNTVTIRPQVGTVAEVEATVPSIKGDFKVKVDNASSYTLEVDIPANVVATVYVPAKAKGTLTVGGEKIAKPALDASGRFYVVGNVGSGHKVFTVK